MISIKNLTKSFGNVIAVNNLSIDIDSGVTGLVGHNGAGKSTLFRLISDVYDADNGEITINGYDSKSIDGKKQVFFLSDDPFAEGNMNAIEVCKYYRYFFDINATKFAQIMTNFKLPLNRPIGNFSKGMKRQLFVCIALSCNVPVILLDEAFDGLDPLVLETIKEQIIKESVNGKTIIVSSHNIHTLERLCDRFVILHKGKLTKSENAEDFGNSFTKYQALFSNHVQQSDLENLGLKIVSFKNVGSLVNFVILNADETTDEKIKAALNPALLEQIGLDSSEILALEMLVARKGDSDDDSWLY